MIFHEKTWGQDGDQVGTKLSAETLGAIWFGDISAPKPYAQYGLRIVYAWFSHGEIAICAHFCKPSASPFISIFEKHINILVNSR